MFVEYFDFFINCMKSIYSVLKSFVLFGSFTFYDFLIFLLIIPIFIKIFHFIMGIEDNETENEEKKLIWRMQRYDEIRVHDNLRIKNERDMNRRL